MILKNASFKLTLQSYRRYLHTPISCKVAVSFLIISTITMRSRPPFYNSEMKKQGTENQKVKTYYYLCKLIDIIPMR